MKRIIGIFCILMAITLCVPAFADTYGFVESRSVSIRVQPDTRSDKLYTAKNSDELVITGQYGDWYIVDCLRSGFSSEEQTGYVLAKYVETSGYQIFINDYVDVYRDPWYGKCNGQRNGTMMVLGETNEWLIVQLNENTPGTGFIKKSDVYIQNPQSAQPENQYNDGNYYIPANEYWNINRDGAVGVYGPNTYVQYEADWYIPKKWSVAIRVRPLTEVPDEQNKKLVILHQYDTVHVIANCGEYAFVRYDDPSRSGGFIEGYVATKYWAVCE